VLPGWRLTEWLFEDGVGERRAALVADGAIVALRVERDSDGAQPGAIHDARLLASAGRGPRLLRLDSGEEALLAAPLPPGLSDGASLRVEIIRAAIAEADLVKRATARPARHETECRPAPSLRERIAGDGVPVRSLRPFDADALEAAGWSEWIEVARSGHLPFPGGLLRISPTPAMTVIDVDGDAAPPVLAREGALAAARAIHALDIGGSIAVDLPTLANKGERVAVAEAFDAALPQPFERTAINGFGLLHLIRPRRRPSLIERIRFAPLESAACALLRRAERARNPGEQTLTAAPGVIDWLAAHPALLDTLSRRTGRTNRLQAEAAQPIWSFDVG
jgi:hypothetical protein